jgi:hypothetical protein
VTARDGEAEKARARSGMWQAMVRGPIVHDVSGHRRALTSPGGLEFVIALILTAAAMIALYGGLDGRNARLLAGGGSFFSPRLSFDDDIALVPIFVVAYYSYFPLLFFFSVITGRDRRLMYEGVIGYVGIAIIGFLFFWLLPSRMVQPDISACTTGSCRSLEAMYRLDNGFNIFPSMHVGYSTLVWLFFRRYMPELSRAVGGLVLAIVLSTLLCKRHYIVDIPAALVMAVVVFVVSQRYGAGLARLVRFAGPALVLVGAALSPRIASADDDPEPSLPPLAPTPSRFSQATQGAIITKPAGAYLRHDVRYRLGDSGVRVGLFDSFLSVSNEIGSSISYATVPEWLALQAEIAAEPGFYLRSPVAESRSADVRTVARAQANLNLRASRFWLYARTTAGLRLRNFDEHDSFRELVLRRELWVEQATALLVRVNAPASAAAPSFWAYGEYTVGRVTSSGSPAATTAVTMPNRVSGGVISENFLAKGLFLDLDLFWSVAPPPTDGFGVIAAFWIAWP